MMILTVPSPAFPLGQLVATPGALQALEEAGECLEAFVVRHACGDWGNLCDADRQENAQALREGGRLMSTYTLKNGETLWIITEADRSVTTLLLPLEYWLGGEGRPVWPSPLHRPMNERKIP